LFNSSVDAFLYIVRSRSVRDVQASIGYMRNGIRRCSVQVSREDGAGYGIEAYGEEVEALFREASKHSKKAYVAMA
jgi:hypothetical protein